MVLNWFIQGPRPKIRKLLHPQSLSLWVWVREQITNLWIRMPKTQWFLTRVPIWAKTLGLSLLNKMSLWPTKQWLVPSDWFRVQKANSQKKRTKGKMLTLKLKVLMFWKRALKTITKMKGIVVIIIYNPVIPDSGRWLLLLLSVLLQVPSAQD